MERDRKARTYVCKHCGKRVHADKAQCPSCLGWHNLNADVGVDDGTLLMTDAQILKEERYATGIADICFSRSESGEMGIVKTSVTLIGGKAGAGKSTLSTQLADALAVITDREVLYVLTEEGVGQVKSRVQRLQLKRPDRIRVLPMNKLSNLTRAILNRKPCAIIIDSLSALVGEDLEAAIEVCGRLKEYSVELNSPSIVIDHITKSGDFAGLEALQHKVDTTMMFEVFDNVRVLRTMKNRMGPAFVCTHFEMTERGLVEIQPPEDDDDDEAA